MYGQPTFLQRALGNRRLVISGAIGIVVVIVGIILLASAARDPVQEGLQRLSIRYGNLTTIAQSAAPRIRSDMLTKLNAEIISLTTSDNTSLSRLVTGRYGAIPADIKKAETDTTSVTQLQKALLLNQYDQTYGSLLKSRFADLLSLISSLQSQSKNVETLALLKTMRSNLSALQDRLNKLNL